MEKHQQYIRTSTDTASPQAVIPIYMIHSLTQPLCLRPFCWCKTHRREVTALFQAIGKGEVTIQHAAPFIER